MRKSTLPIYLLTISVLIACTATPRAKKIPVPSKLMSATITPLPSKIPYTPTPLTLPTDETSIPVKQALISYTVYSEGGDELTLCLQDISHPIFVLYDDGQLIFLRNGQFLESSLTSEDIESLLAEIDQTGIFSVTESSGLAVLFVKGNYYNFSPSDYPEGAIQQTMNILNQLQPEQTVPYVPETLFLWIYPIKSLQSVEQLLPKPVPEIQNWSTDLPHLSEFGGGFINVSGENLPKVMAHFDSFPDYGIFKDGSSLYLTAICAHTP